MQHHIIITRPKHPGKEEPHEQEKNQSFQADMRFILSIHQFLWKSLLFRTMNAGGLKISVYGDSLLLPLTKKTTEELNNLQ